MSALLAWPNGDTAPSVNALDDRTFAIEVDGQSRTISFDPTRDDADYLVDLNVYRVHAGETIPDKATISVTRSHDQINEGSSETVYFYITRSDRYEGDLTVHYSIGGTATAGGVDHSLANSGSVIIPAEQSLVAIPFTVTNDSAAEPDEAITLTIQPDAAYHLGQAATSVTIRDDETVNLFEIEALMEPNATNEVTLRITNNSASPQNYNLAIESADDSYRWNSSNDDNGQSIVPPFHWLDLKEFNGANTASFTALDDGETGALNIGFDFPYYDGSADSIRVNTNGFAYLGASDGSTGGTLRVIPVDLEVSNDAPPAMPGAPSAAILADGEVAVYWRNASNTETGYILQRSTAPDSGFTTIATALQTQVDAAFYVDGDLSDLSNTVYYYRIRAINPLGSSAPTAVQSVGGDGDLIPAEGLALHYAFDESAGATTAIDSSGSNNKGDLTGSGDFTPGRIGNAIEFPGGIHYVDTQETFTVTEVSGFTAAAWVHLPNVAATPVAKIFQHHRRHHLHRGSFADP